MWKVSIPSKNSYRLLAWVVCLFPKVHLNPSNPAFFFAVTDRRLAYVNASGDDSARGGGGIIIWLGELILLLACCERLQPDTNLVFLFLIVILEDEEPFFVS